MTSCTIIIPHYESLPFLERCIKQVRKYANENIRQEIIIVDQSSKPTFEKIQEMYGADSDIQLLTSKPLYSGFAMDIALRYGSITGDFIAQLHTDSFPINFNWLRLPVTLIEENNFSFVGQLQFICDGTQSIYPPYPFFAMAQCYNVARTETYKEMSMEAGFTRFHNRRKSGLAFKNNDWGNWASDYANRGSDDDVVAFAWECKYKNTNKLGLAISGYIEPNYGRIIDGLVFHFGSCREAIGVMDKMPENYKYYTEKINYDYSEQLIDEMVGLAKSNRPPELEILSRNFWDGTLKQSFPTSAGLNKRIEELKNE